ncbi:unnamed protein product [Rhizopus stolonifer]
MITGDGPDVSKLIHHDGAHACKHGCRIFITRGCHPDDKKDPRGMYFVQRNQLIRIKDGITLKNVVGDNNTYNITQPTVFSMIPSFKGVEFFGLDEMYLLSNCGKFVYELVSPKFNKRFCNEQLPNKFLFNLPIEKRLVIAESLVRSRSTIPLSFSGSFEKLNDNTKYLYKSIDCIDFLCEVVPTIVAPLFSNPHTKMALTSLSMACKMANQFEITASELTSIKRNLEVWLNFLDTQIDTKCLSKTVYRINQHHLSHIPFIIQKMGLLRYYSLRPMERTIGRVKRSVRSRCSAGINSGNVLECTAIFQFLEDTGMLSLDLVYNRRKDPLSGKNGVPHLCDPMAKKATRLHDLNGTVQGVPTRIFGRSLWSYYYHSKRLQLNEVVIERGDSIHPFAKFWNESQLYTSLMYKQMKKDFRRGGQHVMFEFTHINNK